MANNRPSKPIYIPLDRVIVYVPPYSVESMQAVQAKLEIKSRIKAIFSESERTTRANRVFHLYTENPHVIDGTLAATRQIGSGSITALFVKRFLNPENFKGHVHLTQDQSIAQRWKESRRSRSNFVALIKAVFSTLRVITSWLIQTRSLAIASLVGIAFVSVKLVYDHTSVSEAQPAMQLAVAEPGSSEASSGTQEKSPSPQPQASTTPPIPFFPIPGRPLPGDEPDAPNVELATNPQSNKGAAPETKLSVKEKAPVKEPTSIALKGEIVEPVEVTSKTATPILEAQDPPQAEPQYEVARWGDQSQLLAFSVNGLVAMKNGRPVEIEAGQSLPNGEVLKSIDKSRSLVVTNRRTIQLTE